MKANMAVAEALRLQARVKQANVQANELLVGRRVRVLSDYNGQPWGGSRPSQRGKVHTVASAFLDGGAVWLSLEGRFRYECALRLDEVEVLDE